MKISRSRHQGCEPTRPGAPRESRMTWASKTASGAAICHLPCPGEASAGQGSLDPAGETPALGEGLSTPHADRTEGLPGPGSGQRWARVSRSRRGDAGAGRGSLDPARGPDRRSSAGRGSPDPAQGLDRRSPGRRSGRRRRAGLRHSANRQRWARVSRPRPKYRPKVSRTAQIADAGRNSLHPARSSTEGLPS